MERISSTKISASSHHGLRPQILLIFGHNRETWWVRLPWERSQLFLNKATGCPLLKQDQDLRTVLHSIIGRGKVITSCPFLEAVSCCPLVLFDHFGQGILCGLHSLLILLKGPKPHTPICAVPPLSHECKESQDGQLPG